MNKLCVLFFLLIAGQMAFAQVEKDSAKAGFSKPSWRFFLGIDASRAGMLIAGSPQQISCGRIEISRRKSSFSLETGLGKHRKSFEGFDAYSSGFYGRMGYSRLLLNTSDAELGFGFGLGASNYTYDARNIRLPGFDTLPDSKEVSYQAKGRSVFWTDLAGMVKTRVWRSVWLGFELRLKFLVKGDSASIPSYFAPGYGIVQNRFLPGFNYFIFVTFPGKNKNIVSKTH